MQKQINIKITTTKNKTKNKKKKKEKQNAVISHKFVSKICPINSYLFKTFLSLSKTLNFVLSSIEKFQINTTSKTQKSIK